MFMVRYAQHLGAIFRNIRNNHLQRVHDGHRIAAPILQVLTYEVVKHRRVHHAVAANHAEFVQEMPDSSGVTPVAEVLSA